jgi:hypothetical protein
MWTPWAWSRRTGPAFGYITILSDAVLGEMTIMTWMSPDLTVQRGEYYRLGAAALALEVAQFVHHGLEVRV